MAMLKVKLVKSTIGRKKDHIATVHALGLKKIRDEKEHLDNAAIRGMIAKVGYMLEVEELQ